MKTLALENWNVLVVLPRCRSLKFFTKQRAQEWSVMEQLRQQILEKQSRSGKILRKIRARMLSWGLSGYDVCVTSVTLMVC
jgi:hypothetical protein